MCNQRTTPAVQSSPSSTLASSPRFWLRIFIIAQLLLLAIEFSPDLSSNGDDAKYYLLGKSLFSGNGYRVMYDPQNPVEKQYPPLFPGLLGAISAVADSPLLPKISIGILSGCIILLLFFYFRPLAGNVLMPLLLITALSSSLASHATLLMSEIPYLAATLAALLLFDADRRRGGTGFFFWAAAAVSIMPAFIRTAGISFSAAWILVAIIEKRNKQAFAHALLFTGAMILLRFATDWHSPYIDQLFARSSYDPELGYVTAAEMVSRIGQNLRLYLSSILPHTVTGIELTKATALTISGMITIPAVVALLRNLFRPTRFISYYLLFYGGIICMWQTQWAGDRFIIPILPFILFFFLDGLCTIVRASAKTLRIALPPSLIKGIVWTAAVIIAAVNFNGHVRLINENARVTADWRNFYSCADWVRLYTRSDAIVASRKPELFYLRSKRKGFVYSFSHDVEKVIDDLKQGSAAYCILDNFFWSNTTVRYLFPAIQSHPELFRVVYSLRNPDTYVLEFTPK